VFSWFEIGGRNSKEGTEVIFEVPEGASTAAVDELLEQQGLIGSALVFRLWCRLQKLDGTFQMGKHKLETGLSYSEIARILRETTYVEVETVAVTVPEGTTTLKLAMMLNDLGLCTTVDFVNECNSGVFDVPFFDEISDDSLKFIKLEGFLYPDTYEFVVGSTPHDMIQMMLENFQRKVLTEEMLAEIEKSSYSLEEIVILASIVQKETIPGEEKNIASVFHNRLNDLRNETNHRLQSDMSRYKFQDESLYNEGYIPNVIAYYYQDILGQSVPDGMREAYDTYSVAGLIVGAISNPGLDSIEGALHPNDTNYLYFFSTPPEDPPIIIVYSETYYEHARKYNEYYS